jgi:hypothetical protein
MIPGKNPASASPNKNRIVKNEYGPTTKAVRPEMIPQVTSIRAIQVRAPTFSRITLLGTSKRKVAEKENSTAKAEDRGRETEIPIHRQPGEPDINPVEISNEVAEHQHRQKPASDPRHRRAL